VEFRDYLRMIRRRWVLIVMCLLTCLAIAALITITATPQYSSSARLFVSTRQTDAGDAYQGGLFSAERVTSYADLVSSRELAQDVIDDLDLKVSPADLAQQVSAAVVPETVNLELTVTDASARQAQRIAQSYAEHLAEMVRELETPSGNETAPIKATIIDAASFSDAPVSPQPLRNLALAAALGLILGIGAAVVRELLDTTIKTAEDLAEAIDASLMGAIDFDPTTPRRPLVTALSPHASRVEAFRVLRTNMQFVGVDRSSKVFVVSSSLPEEGKTTTAANLAITLSQGGHRTALVECDLRRPRVASILEAESAVGVTTVLVGRLTLDQAMQTHEATGLDVLTSGAIPPNPSELLQSKAMASLLTELRSRYDMVIIDAPPLLPVTDATLLAAQADGTLLVVRHGRTTKEQLAHAVDRLAQVDAPVVGVVLNMVRNHRGRSGYGYGYGYAQGYQPDTPSDAGGRRRRGSVSAPRQTPTDGFRASDRR